MQTLCDCCNNVKNWEIFSEPHKNKERAMHPRPYDHCKRRENKKTKKKKQKNNYNNDYDKRVKK